MNAVWLKKYSCGREFDQKFKVHLSVLGKEMLLPKSAKKKEKKQNNTIQFQNLCSRSVLNRNSNKVRLLQKNRRHTLRKRQTNKGITMQ